MENTSSSVEESQRDISSSLSDNILDRLEKRLCSAIGLTEDHQHHLSKNKENSFLGVINLKKKPFHGSLADITGSFYQEEGCDVLKINENLLNVKKNGQYHKIEIIKDDFEYRVSVNLY